MSPLAQPPLTDRARWAVALYQSVWNEDDGSAHARDRRAGIRRYKGASGPQLRADLEPVLRAYPDGTVQRSAAAYVLARYGVDTERNAARLFESGRMDRKGDDPQGNAESLPEALGDLWVVRRSPTALARLIDMPSDGAVGELQADQLVRVFSATPDPVLRAASRSETGWQQLAGAYEKGTWNFSAPKVFQVREKGLLAKLRRDAKRYE